MLSNKLKIRLSFLAGLLSWLLFTFFDLYLLFVERYELNVNLSGILPQVFLTMFIVSTLFYYRYVITKADSINFTDLLWRVFITGLVTTIGSLVIRLFFYVFGSSAISENPLTINLLYHILIGLVTIYLISTFVVWKRLILYQKSKKLIQLWGFFEYSLLGSLAFDFFGNNFMSVNFNTALIFLGGMALILSFNLKWIAYLNFKQKWKSILFILLSGIYIYHFMLNLITFSQTEVLTLDLLDRVFIVAIFIFIFLYAGISILVTLFNLPTSSVFERKLQEAIDFQKLSQSIPSGQSAEQTYDLLLDSSMSAVFADAAWLEIKNDHPSLITRGIREATVEDIKGVVRQDLLKNILFYQFKGDFSSSKVIGSINHTDFRSIIALPIMVKGKQVGTLVLLQEVADAFNREMVEIITTFVNQASISLENFMLIQEAIENERYKEQLKIAKSVQKSLLPSELKNNSSFDITAYSMAADEVGGDYYDILEPVSGIYNLIIGDVSGKGTSAAFNMAQMRGIFHSLAQVKKSSPQKFIMQANAAMARCLEKTSFITAFYFQINTKEKQLTYTRAGHCPALYYSAETKNACYLESDGLGLGIIRNSEYDQYVVESTLTYSPGDLLVLYTDGITEAKNQGNQQYGSEGLKTSLLKHINQPIEKIKEGLISDLIEFLNGNKLDDDYTLTIVRFK